MVNYHRAYTFGTARRFSINSSFLILNLNKAMKKYICPALEINEAQVTNMLAESLAINSDITVDGSEALVKDDNAWDIWASDEE